MADFIKRQKIIDTQMLVKTGVLYAPASFLCTPVDELADLCNGCGAADSNFNWIIPCRIYGTYIGDCCNVHDYMYFIGKTIEDKDLADRCFLNNMLRMIERDKHKWYKPTWLQRIRARTYYNAVRWFAGPAYWINKQ